MTRRDVMTQENLGKSWENVSTSLQNSNGLSLQRLAGLSFYCQNVMHLALLGGLCPSDVGGIAENYRGG